MGSTTVGLFCKDPHSAFENVLASALPKNIRIVRGQSAQWLKQNTNLKCIFFDVGGAAGPISDILEFRDPYVFKILCATAETISAINWNEWQAVIKVDDSKDEILNVVNLAFERESERERHRAENLGTRGQIISLERAKENLEHALFERLNDLDRSKQEMKANLNEARAYTHYLKRLAHCEALEEMLKLLRDELKTFSGISNLSLILSLRSESDTVASFQNGAYIFKRIKIPFPQGNSIRFNEEPDRSCLASYLDRPIGKVVIIPIQRKESGRRAVNRLVNDYLAIEHSLNDAQVPALLSSIQRRLEPFASSVDRALLQQQVQLVSQVWERVFDHLNDGLAIVDDSGQILRSNAAFKSKLSGWNDGGRLVQNSELNLQWKERRFEIRKFPIQFEEAGPMAAQILFFRDLTDDEEMRTALLQNEKMAAIGSLAGRIAHELNNPLTGIVSMCQILINEGSLAQQLSEDLREVENAAVRCQDIIKNLLEFTQPEQNFKLEDVDINDVVKRTIPLLKTALRDFELELQLAEKIPTFRGNLKLMQQVFFNLLINACQASRSGGLIVVQTAVNSIADDWGILLSVADHGAGIPDSLKGKIFDHFFTTKERGKGTGLGLSVSKKIIDSFGGSISLESKEGTGSIFTIKLPLPSARS